jgi:hypothetical protein
MIVPTEVPILGLKFQKSLTNTLMTSFWGLDIYTSSALPSFAAVLPHEKHLHKLPLQFPNPSKS